MLAHVMGEAEHEIVEDGWNYRHGPMFIGSPLPEGYPRPTAPGVVEIKRYPTVRRAEVEGVGSARGGSRGGFFPLFRHITDRGIAMTAPVEMDYGVAGESFDSERIAEGESAWRMSFLYRESDLGPTGEAERGVRVVDAEPVIVLAMGLRGELTRDRVLDAEAALTAWVEKSPEWQKTGKKRWMGYNGPAQRRGLQWWEVQLIIEPKAAAE